MLSEYLKTKDLAVAVQVSVQQIRNYEAQGFIPAVERGPNGYRLYTQQHLAAVKTVRAMIAGYGWVPTRQIMQAIHSSHLGRALRLIDEYHATLATSRQQLDQTQAALQSLAEPADDGLDIVAPRPLRIGEAARLVGVRVSAIYFWEAQGLLEPVREQSSRYRLYDQHQLRRLRVIALLRQAHHDFATIWATLHELEAGQPQRALAAIEQRYTMLTQQSWRCVQALVVLEEYVRDFKLL